MSIKQHKKYEISHRNAAITPEQQQYRADAAKAAIESLGGVRKVALRFGLGVESVRRWQFNGVPRDHIPEMCLALEALAKTICISSDQFVGLLPLNNPTNHVITNQEDGSDNATKI